MIPILCKEFPVPGVPTRTELNIQASNCLAGAALIGLLLAVVIGLAHRRRPTKMFAVLCGMIGAAVMAVHPVWTVPTDTGDCGLLRVWASWAVLGVEGLFVAAQLLLLIERRDSGKAERRDYDDRVR